MYQLSHLFPRALYRRLIPMLNYHLLYDTVRLQSILLLEVLRAQRSA